MRTFALPLLPTVVLALLTLLTGLRAARLWWAASVKMPRLMDFTSGSIEHVLQMESETAEAAALNSKAALWSGATAVLSALTAICGAVAPAIGRWIG